MMGATHAKQPYAKFKPRTREPSPDNKTKVKRLTHRQTCALLSIYQTPTSEYVTPKLKRKIFERIYAGYYKLIFKTLTRNKDLRYLSDVYQDCIFTLEKCMRHFKPELGFKFSTYLWRSVATQKGRFHHYAYRDNLAHLSKEVESKLEGTYDHIEVLKSREAVDEFYKVLQACFSNAAYQRLALIVYVRMMGYTYDAMGSLEGVSTTGKPLSKERIRQLYELAQEKMAPYYGYR